MYKKVSAFSRSALKKLSFTIRKHFGCEKSCFFPIVDVLDKVRDSGEEYDNFDYEILEDNDSLLVNKYAVYDAKNNKIYISNSTYENACEDDGPSRFTLVHEFAHFLLINVRCSAPKDCKKKPNVCEDPEWQADTLAAFLLVPPDLTENFSVKKIIDDCKVSEYCATLNCIKRNEE
ncbi:MAG: hypothetical protein WCR97_00250 [Bacilli bacterium]